MLESLHEQLPEAHVYALCLSEHCYEALEKLAYPFVTFLSLQELEVADPELFAVKNTRSLVEYYFTLTPCLPYYLQQKYELEAITYLDADMLFCSSPKAIFTETEEPSVLLTPHRFPKELEHLEKYGIYNVSWLTFFATPEGKKCLEWYRKACLEWCYDKLEDDKFADQKYLDAFPQKFMQVHSIEHHGAGLAPWNMLRAHFSYNDTGYFVDGQPLIFLHAQGYRHILGPFYNTGLSNYTANLQNSTLAALYKDYTAKYAHATTRAHAVLQGTTFQSIRSQKGKKFSARIKELLRAFMKKNILIHWG